MLRKLLIGIKTLLIGSLFFGFAFGYIVYTDTMAWAESVKAWAPDTISYDQKMKKAKQYHGILVAEYRQDKREWGFYRDNQWCSLYRSIPEGVSL